MARYKVTLSLVGLLGACGSVSNDTVALKIEKREASAHSVNALAPNGASNAQNRFLRRVLYRCDPDDKSSRRLGAVVFEINEPTRDNLLFSEPMGWRGSVVVAPADPPQDYPSLTLRWQDSSGTKLFANLVWPSDSGRVEPFIAVTEIPNDGERRTIGWALWRCAEVRK